MPRLQQITRKDRNKNTYLVYIPEEEVMKAKLKKGEELTITSKEKKIILEKK